MKRVWHFFGILNTFHLGLWAGAVSAGYLVYNGSFPDLGKPDASWLVMGVVYLIGAIFSFSLAKEATGKEPKSQPQKSGGEKKKDDEDYWRSLLVKKED